MLCRTIGCVILIIRSTFGQWDNDENNHNAPLTWQQQQMALTVAGGCGWLMGGEQSQGHP